MFCTVRCTSIVEIPVFSARCYQVSGVRFADYNKDRSVIADPFEGVLGKARSGFATILTVAGGGIGG